MHAIYRNVCRRFVNNVCFKNGGFNKGGCLDIQQCWSSKKEDSTMVAVQEERLEYYTIFNTSWILPDLVHDMLLLENPIPFLVPQRLFDLAVGAEYSGPSLVDLHFFMFNCVVPLNTEIPPSPANSVHHLLHLFHTHLLPSPRYIDISANTHLHHFSTHLHNLFNTHLLPMMPSKMKKALSRPLSTKRNTELSRSATELQDEGVKFRKIVKKVGSIMEIELRKGIMQIPELCIYPNTISFFQNIVAFEQCYPNSNSHFTAYAFFMHKLISSPQDVVLLKQKGIIRHGLGTDTELALLFNQLAKGASFYYSKTYISRIYRELQFYYESLWHKWWRSSFMRDYFSNPWTFLSLLGALLLLLLTMIQTFYSCHFISS